MLNSNELWGELGLLEWCMFGMNPEVNIELCLRESVEEFICQGLVIIEAGKLDIRMVEKVIDIY